MLCKGVPHLSNYPATRVYINPEHYSVHELKKRLVSYILLQNMHEIYCQINKLTNTLYVVGQRVRRCQKRCMLKQRNIKLTHQKKISLSRR